MMDPLEPTLYVTRLKELIWGTVLVAATLGIHGFGMLWTLRFDSAFKQRIGPSRSFLLGMSNLIVASWLMLFVHISEVMMWALFFLWKGCFPNLSIANYFALNEYTTVGSELRLPHDWRLLEGTIAIAGLLAFAWTTGVLLTLARDFQAQQLDNYERRKKEHQSHRADDKNRG